MTFFARLMDNLAGGTLDDTLLAGDRFRELMRRTIGRWEVCPLWVLRGKMFSLAEKALLIGLLDLWHSAGRSGWFYSSNVNLSRLSGLSHRAFLMARRSLLAKCIILSKPGKRGRPKVGAVPSTSLYTFSQDFLCSLTKDQVSPTLNTSTYSGGAEVTLFNGNKC